MKTLTTMIAITSIAFTARASEPVPYIAMPIDKGYAIDAHGKRQPNALCARDIIWARVLSHKPSKAFGNLTRALKTRKPAWPTSAENRNTGSISSSACSSMSRRHQKRR
jgi:hypothetical protein